MSSCISWCKGSAAEEASTDDDDACILEDEACMLEDDACMLEDDEDEEDEEVSEDAAASSWPVADMSGRRSMEEVRRGLWLRSMLAPHWSLARTLIYGRAVTRGDKSDTGHSPSSSWQFHGPSGMFDKVRKNLKKIETNWIDFIYFG